MSFDKNHFLLLGIMHRYKENDVKHSFRENNDPF